MPRTIHLTTGDITKTPPGPRNFTVSQAGYQVDFDFDGVPAAVALNDWQALVAQIKTRSLTQWKFGNMPPPIGSPGFQRLLAGVSNTPAYQLLLAGFDVAQVVGLTADLDDQIVFSRCLSLNARIPARIGLQGLFFVSDTLFTNVAPPDIDNLVQNNKLCRLTATVGNIGNLTKYYIPYATPSGFTIPSTPGSKSLWERVRTYYYAFR